MCDLIEPQPSEKIGRMKKLRRTLSESFSRIALKKDDTTFDELSVHIHFLGLSEQNAANWVASTTHISEDEKSEIRMLTEVSVFYKL
ncbi:hypothetical protein STEG23_001031 [Scotinomys teguina]